MAVLAGGTLGVLGRLTQDVWPMAVAAAILGMLVVCYLAAAHAPAAHVHVGARQLVRVGERSACQLTVSNPSRRRTAPTLVHHETCAGLLAETTAFVGSLARGDSVTVPLTAEALRRGHADHVHLRVETPGPFGLFRRESIVLFRTSVVVAPEARRHRQAPIDPGGGDGRLGALGGDQVRGIRAWRPGDSPRRVHWRSTARSGSLTVVEHAQPRSETVVFVAVGTAGERGYEDAIAAAAALATAALEEGTPARLLWRVPGRGEVRRVDLTSAEVLAAFARLPTSEPPPPAWTDALMRSAARGAAIVLVAGPDEAFPGRGALEAAAHRGGAR